MNTLVAFHILCMSLSLLLLPTAIAAALMGAKRSVTLASIGTLFAGVGSALGFVLLIQSPIVSQCVILTAYLAATISLYAFGFAWGNPSKARLLRNIS